MKRQRLINIVFAAALVLLVGGFVWAFVYNLKTKDDPEEPIAKTSIAAPSPDTPRELVSAEIDTTGNLILTYSDDSVENVGRVRGASGNDGKGLYPTDEQVRLAVNAYCMNGKCDAKNPTQGQVMQAVISYCAGGECRGSDGKDAVVTAEQLISAVAAYCQDGRCKGQTGDTGAAGPAGATGPQGAAGRDTTMACVIRTTNGTATRYVAWKYTTDDNSTYKDIYKLPNWAEGSNCIAL